MSEFPTNSNEAGWLPDIQAEIAEHHNRRDFRPVIVAIIQNPQGEVLLLQSAKNRKEWMFPQGGIDVDEPVLHALTREVREEVSIDKDELKGISYRGRQRLDAEPGRTDKRGYSRGKSYYFFDACYTGTSPLTLDPTEIVAFHWLHPFNVDRTLSTTRPEKRKMMLEFLFRY